MTHRIYVVGFAASVGANRGVSGFDWYETWSEACIRMIEHLMEGDTYLDKNHHAQKRHGGFDYRMTAVDVPDEIWETDLEMPIAVSDVVARRRQMVTDWLEGLEL